jgi:hypothetical protein
MASYGVLFTFIILMASLVAAQIVCDTYTMTVTTVETITIALTSLQAPTYTSTVTSLYTSIRTSHITTGTTSVFDSTYTDDGPYTSPDGPRPTTYPDTETACTDSTTTELTEPWGPIGGWTPTAFHGWPTPSVSDSIPWYETETLDPWVGTSSTQTAWCETVNTVSESYIYEGVTEWLTYTETIGGLCTAESSPTYTETGPTPYTETYVCGVSLHTGYLYTTDDLGDVFPLATYTTTAAEALCVTVLYPVSLPTTSSVTVTTTKSTACTDTWNAPWAFTTLSSHPHNTLSNSPHSLSGIGSISSPTHTTTAATSSQPSASYLTSTHSVAAITAGTPGLARSDLRVQIFFELLAIIFTMMAAFM